MGSPTPTALRDSSPDLSRPTTVAMDAIRKKMKSLKDETDQLYAIIQKFEDATKEATVLLTRLIATSGTTARKSTASRSNSTRHWTNRTRPTNNLRRRTRATRKLKET